MCPRAELILMFIVWWSRQKRTYQNRHLSISCRFTLVRRVFAFHIAHLSSSRLLACCVCASRSSYFVFESLTRITHGGRQFTAFYTLILTNTNTKNGCRYWRQLHVTRATWFRLYAFWRFAFRTLRLFAYVKRFAHILPRLLNIEFTFYSHWNEWICVFPCHKDGLYLKTEHYTPTKTIFRSCMKIVRALKYCSSIGSQFAFRWPCHVPIGWFTCMYVLNTLYEFILKILVENNLQ